MAAGPDQHHRQLPVRARRLDGDADGLDDREVPRRVRAAHREARARARASGLPRGGARRARRRRATRRPRQRAMARPEPSVRHLRDRRPRGVARPRARCSSTAPSTATSRSPYFCYEPKLGQPVGACRMCLVEIEGIPKLQTACSTPVKDGMVVITTSDRVKQRAERGRRVPAREPPARLPGLRQGRRVPAPGHLLRLGRRAGRASSSRSATSRSRSSSRRSSPSTASAASSATAACASRRRSPRTTSWSSSSAATTPSWARTTATRTWRRSAATSSSCARSAR